MTGRALVLRGDARTLPLPDASINAIITSPPYYRARDYTDGGESLRNQIGQEPTPDEYLTNLATVLAECRRVLRPDGTCWINLADVYSGKANGGESVGRSGRGDHADVIPNRVNTTDFAPYKSLLQIPERFSIAATTTGWVLRNRIVWHKRNGMRHPVTDRFVNLHETLLMLTPNSHYWFDLDAVREPLAHPEALDGTRVWGGRNKHRGGRIGASARLVGRVYGTPKFTDARPGRRGHGGGSPERNTHPLGRNPGDVWDIPTEPLIIPDQIAHARCCAGAKRPGCEDGLDHYAPFPIELARRCVLAGSPPGGVVVDPFGGSGTAALVARALGRIGITVDLSADYGRLAQWRTTDRGELAKALRVAKPPRQVSGQLDLFGEVA